MVKGSNTLTENILSRENRFNFHGQKKIYQRLYKTVCIILNLWAVYLHYPSNSLVYILNPRQMLILVSFPIAKPKELFYPQAIPGRCSLFWGCFHYPLEYKKILWTSPDPWKTFFLMFLHVFKYNQNLF